MKTYVAIGKLNIHFLTSLRILL